MNARTRRRLVVVFAGVFACIAVWPGLVYRERSSYRCDVCFAKRDRLQWWIGRWEFLAIPITPAKEEVTASKFGEDFLPSHSQHTWKFAQGSPYYWGFMWGGCGIGAGRHRSQTLREYESNARFRKFVQGRLRNGSMDRARVIAVFSDTSRDRRLEEE
jgi:hypothetical protein